MVNRDYIDLSAIKHAFMYTVCDIRSCQIFIYTCLRNKIHALKAINHNPCYALRTQQLEWNLTYNVYNVMKAAPNLVIGAYNKKHYYITYFKYGSDGINRPYCLGLP